MTSLINDHAPTFVHFQFSCAPNETLSHSIKFRPVSQRNIDNLVYKLQNINLDFVYNSSNIEVNCKYFYDTLNRTYRECFPIKTKQITEKRMGKPWLSTYILKLVI